MNAGDLEKRVENLERENIVLDSKILELYTLYSISKKLSLTTQLDEIFNGTMDHISRSLNIDDFCIMLFNEKRDRLEVCAYHGDEDLQGVIFKPDEGVTGQVASGGEMVLIQDVSRSKDFLYYKGRKKNIGSFLCIPLTGKDNNILGTLNVHKFDKNAFAGKDIELFKEVADQIAIAIYKALFVADIREQSIRDELTTLYNRRYFFDYFEREIARAKRYEHPVSVIIVDVDHFKNFNDTNGHILGDQALQSVASVLSASIRQSDIVARIGGEEFIVALVETPKEMALKVAEKLRAAVESERIEGEENQPGGRLTATFGVSSYPEDAEFATELIDCADKALYQGKGGARNVVVSFSSSRN